MSEVCQTCRSSEDELSAETVNRLLNDILNWNLIEVEGAKQLERHFKFVNFQQALAFTNKVAALAEEANHHPMIITEWGRVTVRWWTHSINGLDRHDFVCAAKTDTIFKK